MKLRQKVSGCLRTLTGARQFCAIRSYLSTAVKHGKHFFEVLVMLAEGRPWLPATAGTTLNRPDQSPPVMPSGHGRMRHGSWTVRRRFGVLNGDGREGTTDAHGASGSRHRGHAR
jgi:hypothetical protein